MTKLIADKPTVTFEQFLEVWEQSDTNKVMRRGQTLMNLLHTVWEHEYKRISSVHYYDRTDIDCFYNDSLISNTLNHLGEIWKYEE